VDHAPPYDREEQRRKGEVIHQQRRHLYRNLVFSGGFLCRHKANREGRDEAKWGKGRRKIKNQKAKVKGQK